MYLGAGECVVPARGRWAWVGVALHAGVLYTGSQLGKRDACTNGLFFTALRAGRSPAPEEAFLQ